VGDKLPDPRLESLIPDPETANRKWSESHGGVPINHMLVIREGLARTRPDVVREIYRVDRRGAASERARLAVFLTNLLAAPGVELAGPFPGDLQQHLVFVGAVSADSTQAVPPRRSSPI
jgi:hypothetical protein